MDFIKKDWRNYKNITPSKFLILTLIILILITIIYDCTLDECESPYSKSFNGYKFNDEVNDKKVEFQINYLIQKQISFTSRIDRKETNAWASFALYVTGLAALLHFLKVFTFTSKCKVFWTILLIWCVAISAFSFIHKQYSAIYNTSANEYASTFLISKIVDKGKPISNMSYCLDQLYLHALYQKQPFRGNKHPMKILKYYIFGDWVKSSGRILTVLNITEAALYFLMVVFSLVISFFVTSKYSEKKPKNRDTRL